MAASEEEKRYAEIPEHCVVIVNKETDEVWTVNARWGRIPKLYPTLSRAKAALKYHAANDPEMLETCKFERYDLKFKDEVAL